jgi:Carboxypeptidase regulatory-like domain
MRIAYLTRSLLALSMSALASTALGAVPQPPPTIRGIVVDPTGAPLPGAVVSLDLQGVTTVTSADGRFAITLGTPGKRRVTVSLAGFQSSEATVVLPETASEGAIEELRITLVPVVPVPRTQAQPAPTPASDYRWSVEFGLGFDNSISGNINSGAVGTINNQAVVITKNRYEDVYGTGLHLRFGGGYMLDGSTEVRAMFTYQSVDADLTRMGDIGSSSLYGEYDDYQSFGLDVGLRRYTEVAYRFHLYGEGTIGLAFIDETDVMLVAPGANLAGDATDFYDRTAAFTAAGNAGVLFEASERFGVFGQLGLRYVTGMSEVDGLAGTGLEEINDSSARWTLPFLIGARARF